MNATRRTRKATPSLPPYFEAMMAESARTGFPGAFATDLTEHDRAALESLRPTGSRSNVDRIGWILYRSGTHLALLAPGEALKHKNAAGLRDFGEAEGGLFFIGEGGKLRQVSGEDYSTLMTRSEERLEVA